MCHSREGGNPGIKFTVLGIKQETKMKRKLFLPILIVFFTTSFMSLVGCNNQKSTKEQSTKSIKEVYELQEKCGKRCEEWVKKDYNGRNCSYKNHYNNKLNKCFILVSCNDGVPHELLFDVNENNNLGGLSDFKKGSVFCSIMCKECKSKSEWDLLVKPYMEE